MEKLNRSLIVVKVLCWIVLAAFVSSVGFTVWAFKAYDNAEENKPYLEYQAWSENTKPGDRASITVTNLKAVGENAKYGPYDVMKLTPIEVLSVFYYYEDIDGNTGMVEIPYEETKSEEIVQILTYAQSYVHNPDPVTLYGVAKNSPQDFVGVLKNMEDESLNGIEIPAICLEGNLERKKVEKTDDMERTDKMKTRGIVCSVVLFLAIPIVFSKKSKIAVMADEQNKLRAIQEDIGE